MGLKVGTPARSACRRGPRLLSASSRRSLITRFDRVVPLRAETMAP
jgi:hypothetical protein